MHDLIDRYVLTALRRVPEQQRADIDRELRASIDDAVDARVDGGEPRDAAVEAALLELGDPDRLADGYAGRRQFLIGPELYPVWRRLLTTLLMVVLPIVTVVLVVLKLLDDPAIGPVVGTAVSTLLTVGSQMAFWTTLVFAVLERTGVSRDDLPRNREWSLADLPRYEPGFMTRGQLAANLVWPVLLIVALVLQQFTLSDVPVLDPANWTFWWPYFIAVLLLECAYFGWIFRRGAWSRTVTLANAALQVLFTGPLVWLLATENFFNPAFVATLDWGGVEDPLHWLTLAVGTIAVVGAVWDVVDVAVRGEKGRRGVRSRVAGL